MSHSLLNESCGFWSTCKQDENFVYIWTHLQICDKNLSEKIVISNENAKQQYVYWCLFMLTQVTQVNVNTNKIQNPWQFVSEGFTLSVFLFFSLSPFIFSSPSISSVWCWYRGFEMCVFWLLFLLLWQLSIAGAYCDSKKWLFLCSLQHHNIIKNDLNVLSELHWNTSS